MNTAFAFGAEVSAGTEFLLLGVAVGWDVAGGGVFVILLKDKSLTRYSALYAVRDTKLGLMAKLHGVGPAEVHGDMLVVSLKYDSGGRRFVEMNGAKGLPANACAIKLRR